MEDILKNTIDALENSLGEFTQLKNSLLDSSLEQFEYLFKLENQGQPLFETVEKKKLNPYLKLYKMIYSLCLKKINIQKG